ncbi:MAG: serine/threonine protein kinase, partial [Myxococcales bacterium]|nr:serine/threonine protein kinase [Myxococcales bacterium]
MGSIYLATQLQLERDVVVKTIRAKDDDDAEARFQREARSLSRLSHPNVVQIFDHGRDAETGLLFIVMEAVPGINLSQYLKEHGALPFSSFAAIATQLASGVGEAHRQGLIHRDLKPSNI